MAKVTALVPGTTELETITKLRKILSESEWAVRMCVAEMDSDFSWYKDHKSRKELMETARRMLKASIVYPTTIKPTPKSAAVKRPCDPLNYSDDASKRRTCYNAVKQIISRTGWYVDYVEFKYDDGSSDGHGNHDRGTSTKCETLNAGETIIEAEQQGWSYGYLGSALIFRLSTGREIKIHGSSGQKNQGAKKFSTSENYPITNLLFDDSKLVDVFCV